MEQFKDPQLQQYFNTLPAFIQDSILQSGINITSVEQMKNCAKNAIDQKK